MYMKPETKERYIKNQKLAVIAIEVVLSDLKKEARVNIKYFKEIKEICERQLEAEQLLREEK